MGWQDRDYSRPNRGFSIKSLFTEGGTPFTRIVIACYLVSFLTVWLLAATPTSGVLTFINALTHTTPTDWRSPWTLFTYPLLTFDIRGFLFGALFMLFIGTSVERAWGTKLFAIFYFAMALVNVGAFFLAHLLYHAPMPVPQQLVPTAVFVAFCLINYGGVINFYGLIPVKVKWLLWVAIAIVFFDYGYGRPPMGVLALIPLGAAVLWAQYSLDLETLFSRRAARASDRLDGARAKFSPNVPKSGAKRKHDDDLSWRDVARRANPLERAARARRKKQFERLFDDDK